MNTIRRYYGWWGALLACSWGVAALAQPPTSLMALAGMAGRGVGHMLFALILTGLPWLVSRLFSRPLSGVQFMATFTTAWLMIAVLGWIGRAHQ